MVLVNMIALFLIQFVVLNELEKSRGPYHDRKAHASGVPLRKCKVHIEDRLSDRLHPVTYPQLQINKFCP